jgi:uncharacterized repeat protein (TIGR01451 family)
VVSAPELACEEGDRLMKVKHVLRTTAVVAVVMTVGLIAGSARADVWTDRNVYQAGDTVLIGGDGMQAGESVGVEVFLPDASLAQHHDVLADSQGNFTDSYTLPADAPSGDYTVVATGAQSGNSFTTTFDPIGAGALNCPLTVHNPTHYKLQVGTTVTCTIDGASEVSGQSTTTVYIKSTPLGNSQVTGTVTGTGDDTQITFTYTARGDGCDTTIVAYDNVGTSSNNTIISGDPTSPAAAGFAYVDGNGNVIDCGGGQAHVSILKVADEPTVFAGDTIGFTITVTSDGTATALNVQVSDTLPTDPGTSWSIDGGTGAGDCAIAAGILTCDFGDMASPSNLTVHITSPTTMSTVHYSPVVNTATVTSDNGGSGESTDEVEVICPRVTPSITRDAATVLVGNPAGFTFTATRKMAGTVHGIILTGYLPKGMVWTLDGGTAQALCSIAGSTMTCNLGDMSPGSTYTAHVTAVTTKIGTLTAKAQTSGPSPLVNATAKATITVL